LRRWLCALAALPETLKIESMLIESVPGARPIGR
jgi:hypothetical protein